MERMENFGPRVSEKNDQGKEVVNMTKKNTQKPEASRILRKLPKENAFFFFTSVGNYTGKSAASFEEFLEEIREIDIKSLEFHRGRGDFEKWIAETLGDETLAEKIKALQNLSFAGDILRNQLVLTLTKHYEKFLRGGG